MGTGQHRFIKLKAAAFVIASLYPISASAQKPTLEIYGFGQADAIADFKVNDPNWYDVNRPSKLPSFPGEFGSDGHFYLSPRQSRFGAKGVLPTSNGDVTAVFEFDMFGVGVDKGQTTIRLRHAYGQWGRWLAGQTNTLFMDASIFPNVIDYWGPAGMAFIRNPQIRYEVMDHHGKNNSSRSTVSVAIERPNS